MNRAVPLIGLLPLLPFLLLMGCGQGARAGRASIECAIGPDASWSPDCTVERQGDLLTLRHGDGGFRRFRIVRDGRGVVSADGSEGATVSIAGKDRIELEVGTDHYRLPAMLRQGARE